jgi:hypothetical protein
MGGREDGRKLGKWSKMMALNSKMTALGGEEEGEH